MRIMLFCLAAFVLLSAGPAAALSYSYTETEKAVFAFYQLAHQRPDFEDWIKFTPAYMQAPKERRPEIFNQENLRLQWGFGTLDMTKETLRIKTAILLQLRKTDKGDVLSFKFADSGNSEIPYFPFPYGPDFIDLVIDDLQNYVSITLNPEQNDNVRKHMKEGTLYKGEVVLRVAPVSADASAPLVTGDIAQWLLLGNVVYIEFRLNDPAMRQTVPLWSYTNPVYLSDTEKELLPLMGQ